MKPKTLAALKGSIAKWEAIVAGTGYDNGTANCPLCVAFYHNDCFGCPVYEKTGKECCEDTPYDEITGPLPRWFDTESEIELARAELAFLKSLLPQT